MSVQVPAIKFVDKNKKLFTKKAFVRNKLKSFSNKNQLQFCQTKIKKSTEVYNFHFS